MINEILFPHRFVLNIDQLFDIFNSKSSKHSNIFKRVLSMANRAEIFGFLRTMIVYFKSLKIEDVRYYKNKHTGVTRKVSKIVPLLNSSNRTAFRGFIIDAESLISMYTEYVEEKLLLESISTYTLQQDVIEMFFGRVRAKCGYNSNPNVHQFKGAYRQLSTNIKIQISKHANCRYFDNELPITHNYSNITTVSSKRAKFVPNQIFEQVIEDQQEDILEEVFQLAEIDSSEPFTELTSNFSIAHTASAIEIKIENNSNFHCDQCRQVFTNNQRIDINAYTTNVSIAVPCVSTFEICKTADKFMKLYDITASKPKYDFKVIYCLIFRALDFSNLYTNSQFDCDINHKYAFIKHIVGEYVRVTSMYKSRQATFEQHGQFLRKRLNRLVIESGQ